jgi:hypothetical protein
MQISSNLDLRRIENFKYASFIKFKIHNFLPKAKNNDMISNDI